MRHSLIAVLFCLVSSSFAYGAKPEEAEWPRFRGTDGNGRTTDASVPVKWDASGVAWKTPLKGHGFSSPVVWGGRIFLTSAVDDGKQRLVYCIDARDGKVLWEQVAWSGSPEPSHEMNGWATASCCTDGEHVYASFGKAGLHCYTIDGRHVWSRQLGEFLSSNRRGTTASPVLAGKLVILNGDSESDPFLFGIDKLTGATVWKTGRPAIEGYSTPVLVTAGDHQELVLNGDPFVAGYDPATGKQLWKCRSFDGRGEPLPAIGDDVVYVFNGKAADIYAVRPGGSGDVTTTRMVWHTPRRGGRDAASPILVNGFLVEPNMAGIVCCYDAATGKEAWKKRLGGAISASPFAVERRAYLLFENGETVVLEPDRTPKVLARNTVGSGEGEIFRASPAPCAGHILLRSDTTLYCVGPAEGAGNAAAANAAGK